PYSLIFTATAPIQIYTLSLHDALPICDLEERPRLRVHRRLPELLGVHLAEPLVALEGGALFGQVEDGADELGERLHRHFLPRPVENDGRPLGERGQELVELVEGLEVGRPQGVHLDHGRKVARQLDDRPLAVLALVDLDPERLELVLRPHRLNSRADLLRADPALRRPELRAQEAVDDLPRNAALHELRKELP